MTPRTSRAIRATVVALALAAAGSACSSSDSARPALDQIDEANSTTSLAPTAEPTTSGSDSASANFVAPALSADSGGPARYAFENLELCAIDFGDPLAALIHTGQVAEFAIEDSSVWVGLGGSRLGESADPTDSTDLGYVFNDLYTLSWRPDLGPGFETYDPTLTVTSDVELQAEISALGEVLAQLDSFDAVVEFLSTEFQTTPLYAGPGSNYDVFAQYQQDSETATIFTAGQPLSPAQNSATWGSLSHSDEVELSASDLFAMDEPVPVVDQIIYAPMTEPVVSMAAGRFVSDIETIIDDSVSVEAGSLGLQNRCGESPDFQLASQRPADQMITAYEFVATDHGQRLKIFIEPPNDGFFDDSLTFGLNFGPRVSFSKLLDVDPDTFAPIVPDEIEFDAELTEAEADFFDRLLAESVR